MGTLAGILLVVTLAFAPGLFWLWYFYKKDKIEPEPLHLVRNCFLLGMVATIPAIIVELFVEFVFPSKFVSLSVTAPIVEEICKFLVVYLAVYKHAEFDEPMDGVVYGVASALGFASLENVFYLAEAYRSSGTEFATTALIRALMSVPGHALQACMWGYALGFAKFADPQRGRRMIIMGLLLAMVLHGVFNFCAFVAQVRPLLGALAALGMMCVVAVMWVLAIRRIRKALASSPHDVKLNIDVQR
ncbi:PrsW family intramembrane metalloprotease [Thermodesulfobacteriota bacterium]